LDAIAFAPPYSIRHGSELSRAQTSGGKFEIVTTGLDGQSKVFIPERVLGVEPLRQFLIPAPGGRFQMTELAFDPNYPGWFDVYGEEDRRPGEWGHWTGRGMTWNSMCANCHNTSVRKNYREDTDSFATTLAESGVGCEACHGPMADHNAWQAKHPSQDGDPTVRRIPREAMFSVCGSCHARRGDLTGEFRPGDSFFDHFALSIPDETDLFYPDGQIRDEDFEFTAFQGSRMRAAGVRCIDCHEPHSVKTRVAGNFLCLVCHGAPAPPAPKIDPAAHSHHQPGTRGDNCTDCHMPQTVYMQRHSRHDHGFTCPDPLLTRELGIPNACSRCHADRGIDWSIEAADKWYGPAMERPARARTRIIARARTPGASSPAELLGLLRSETNGFWRAVSANLLKRWAAEPEVAAALVAGSGDPDPLVRAISARALEPLAQSRNSPVETALRARLDDPVRSVRVDAAWALRATVDTNSPAGRDLLAYLRYNADQPSAVLQMGVLHLDRGDLGGAMACFRRAVSWDTNSVPLHHALAVGLSMEGRTDEAVAELETACRLAPRDAESRFKLGLALNEAGQIDAARAALAQAVKLEPSFAQAWYNLGLAYAASSQDQSALESLVRAESLDAHSAQIPYARATVLARLGRLDEARAAARRALELQPTYPEANELLRTLR
jgi:Flp pilus assembly protein TadD